MLVQTVGNIRAEIFGSFGDFVRVAKGNTRPESSNGNSEEWAGTPDLQSACDVALAGWHDVRPEVDKMLDRLTERLGERFGSQYVTTHDVTGAFVDMGRFMDCEPECMVSFIEQPQAAMGRIVKILVAGTASAYIDPADIRRRGTAVIALVDCIHKLGLGVELWWENAIRGDDRKTYSTVVKIHDSAEPMDIDEIMFAMAHPSMLRRLTFSIQEQSTTKKQQGAYAHQGYGTPTELGMTKLDNYDVIVERLQSGDEQVVQDSFEWVMSTVTGLGIAE